MESVQKSKAPGDSFDMNGQNFNPDIYLQKLLKEKSLDEIMDQEKKIVHDTQKLHSDMQTLVYENYNKFIYATDTIKKMKSDFKKMENEMDHLARNMDSITSFSDQISNTLQDTRHQISKLSAIHSLLKRLQFLFKLPNKLKSLMDEGNYSQAVQDYLHTQQVLNRYAHLESFKGIQNDCILIVKELKDSLREQLRNKETSAKDLTQSIELLLLLGEPAENLYIEILTHSSKRLKDQLDLLSLDVTGQDMIEYVDMVNNGFLSDLCLLVTSFNELFVNLPESREYSELASNKLNEFVKERMKELMETVVKRVEVEQDKNDLAIIIRALDRFYSSLSSLTSLFNHSDFSVQGIELILSTGRRACRLGRESLEAHLDECIRMVRQGLAGQSCTTLQSTSPSQESASQLLASLVLTTVERVKANLRDLMLFVEPELSFLSDSRFSSRFSVNCVRGELVIGFLESVVSKARSYTESQVPSPPTLLVLAKMCLEFQSIHVNYIFNLVEEYFMKTEKKMFTKEKEEICEKMHLAAQDLVNHYVRVEGNTISQMLRKSVETRDWVHSPEPRTVRAVMKRVLEEITSVDTQVGSLFEEGSRADRSSDSSRRTSRRANWAPHVHKLFSERIEVFAPVQFSKVSILTGIIKISLKTLLECVRLRTFNKFGLQQIQVDTHYLQLYLWRYVSDENLVHLLLDEILGSAVHRCMEPALMDPSVVEIICERG